MSAYIFLKPYKCDGYYEEPVYDECPDVASYTSEISKNFAIGKFLEGTVISSDIFKLSSSSYGVSMHGSHTFLYINVEELLKAGIIKVATEKDCEIRWAKEELGEIENDLMMYDYFKEDFGSRSEDFAECWVNSILSWIHAKADLIIAQL